MKILIIIVSNKMIDNLKENIFILNNYVKELSDENTIEYAGISSYNDFENYEDIINFKYKIISSKKQFNKICDFISDYIDYLDYDWYIKFRPEVKLLEQINFNDLLITSINARARVYTGPKKIKYGGSTGGIGVWKNTKHYYYNDEEKDIILDDHIYFFHHNIIKLGGFQRIEPHCDDHESEWFHTKYWNLRNIPLNVIGINMVFTYEDGHSYGFSSDINI
jgi:hypothetical protein